MLHDKANVMLRADKRAEGSLILANAEQYLQYQGMW